MTKTWKPTTAGILSIIAGAVQVLLGLVSSAVLAILGATGEFASIPGMGGIMAALGIPSIIIGIVAIVGGVYALKRRVWGLALAGAICALPGILGILAIIFVAMGRGEFEQKTG